MKKGISIFILCSILLITTAGTVKAGNSEYSITEYWATQPVTYDGMWTNDLEWVGGPGTAISEDAIFTYILNVSSDYTVMMSEFLVENFGDTTDDAGDYVQICIDSTNGGGSAPQTGYGRIDIIGHTDIVCYLGNGTGWTEIAVDDDIEWAALISESPYNSTAHWILELQFDKQLNNMLLGQPPNGLRIAVYDENTDTLESWPPESDVDNPDSWGVVADYSSTPYSDQPIPEGLTFGVMAALSSIALLAGSHYLRKRSKKSEK
jgi:hypothetical protein